MRFFIGIGLFAVAWVQAASINLAVSEFEAQGLTTQEAAIITDRLRVELIGTGSYRVMERSMMDYLLQEQGFQQSGACNSSECQVQVGRLLGVERVVIGSVGKLGNLYSISVRMLNVETGEILCAFSEDHEGAIEGLLKGPLKALALQLAKFSNPNAKIQPMEIPKEEPKVVSKKSEKSGRQYWGGHSTAQTLTIKTKTTEELALARHTRWKFSMGFFGTGSSGKTTDWRAIESEAYYNSSTYNYEDAPYEGTTEFDGNGYYMSASFDFSAIQPGGHLYVRGAFLYSIIASSVYLTPEFQARWDYNDYTDLDITNWMLPQIGGVYRVVKPKYEYWGSLLWAPVSLSFSDVSVGLNFVGETGIEYGSDMGIGFKFWFYSGIIPTGLPSDIMFADVYANYAEYERVNIAMGDLYFFKRF